MKPRNVPEQPDADRASRSRAAVWSLLALLSAPAAPAALGQEATQDAADAQDVVVTATRRSEVLRDVPGSVSVISTDHLQEVGAKDLSDYIYQEPGVNYQSTGVAGRGDIAIRGVTTGAQTTPTVGVYVDDVPIGSSVSYADSDSAFDQRLLDLNRLEVLKGPQGTYYGISSMGGLLKYVTNEPDRARTSGQVGGDVSFTDHGTVNSTVQGVVNAPLADGGAAVRLSVFDTEDGGYVDATGVNGGQKINGGYARGGRIAFLAEPVEGLTVKLTAQFQKSDEDGKGLVDYDLKGGDPLVGEYIRKNLFYREPQDQENQLYTATVAYDLGWAKLSSITGYQAQRFYQTGDFSAVYTLPIFSFLGLKSAFSEETTRVNKLTQEFRIVSQADGPVQWLAGFFYTHEDNVIAQDIIQQQLDGLKPRELLFGPDAGYKSKYNEYAGYGTVDWHVLPSVTVTGGVRVAHNEQDILQVNTGLFSPPANTNGTSSDTPVTFLAAARYEFAPQNNVYVRVASGYRAGGPNLGLVDPVSGKALTNSPTYGSDSLVSYELGYKGDNFDRKLSVEASVYDIEWSDIQQIGSLNGSSFRTNAGGARIQGAELGVQARPAAGLQVGAGLSLIDAQLTDDALVGLQARKTAELPDTAKYSATFNASYSFEVAGRPASVTADQLFLGRRNSSYTTSTSNPNFVLPAFTQTDLSAQVSFERFTVGGYIRNVFNNRGELAAITNQAALGGSTFVTLIRPFTVGMTVTAPF